VTLNVDAAFLGFWGCVCPQGRYWGYVASAAVDALATEAKVMGPYASLGRNETALSGRVCLPCPAGVVCSPLAVVDAPHQLAAGKSLYPQSAGPLDVRALKNIVYASGIVPCLHPAVCNRGRFPVTVEWNDWSALVANGTTTQPGFSRYQCREGHDALSLKCSRCEEHYWLDGFLCRPCRASYPVVMPLSVVAGLAALAFYVRHRVGENTQLRDSAADQKHLRSHTTALVLWFLQVSATLQMSKQINQAAGGTSLNADSHLTDNWSLWLQDMLSFRPWGGECVFGSHWDFRVSSGVLFSLPWLVVAVGCGLALAQPARWRAWLSFACILLDLLYLPVTQRAVMWFNVKDGMVRCMTDSLRFV
jgi:hypothetical protein